jgi:hypothetical protein
MSVRVRWAALVLAVSLSACGGGFPDAPSPSPTPSPARSSPRPPLGTEALAQWTAGWRGPFQRFADDLSDAVLAIRSGDTASLGNALQRIPGDAQETATAIRDAGPPPPGLADEARRLRGLVERIAGLTPALATDCLQQAGLACAGDAANLLSTAGQILQALRPFGVNIRFRVDL